MKLRKELVTHFTFLVALLMFSTISKGWFDLVVITYWLGGIIGTLLPDLDQLVYVYFMRPKDPVSIQAANIFGQRDIRKAISYLAETREGRSKLVFHTAQFQVFFLIFAFLVVSSTGSLLGRGIVLGFALHLLIDQVIDYMETGSLNNWFRQIPFRLEERQKVYWVYFMLLMILLLAFIY